MQIQGASLQFQRWKALSRRPNLGLNRQILPSSGTAVPSNWSSPVILMGI